MTDQLPAPIFVVGRPTPDVVRVGAMLASHPDTFGIPDFNLFVATRLETAWSDISSMGDSHADGLLRTVALLYAGDQSIAAVQMARRWAQRRYYWPTQRIFDELRAKVAPLALVDRSRVYAVRPDAIANARELYPDARFAFVVNHPRRAGANAFSEKSKRADGPTAGLAKQIPGLANALGQDPARPAAAEPPHADWARINRALADALEPVPAEARVLVRVEDVEAAPETALAAAARGLGLSAEADAVAAMRRPQEGPFAAAGPANAPLGDDLALIADPARPLGEDLAPLAAAPLPREIAALAATLGYDEAKDPATA